MRRLSTSMLFGVVGDREREAAIPAASNSGALRSSDGSGTDVWPFRVTASPSTSRNALVSHAGIDELQPSVVWLDPASPSDAIGFGALGDDRGERELVEVGDGVCGCISFFLRLKLRTLRTVFIFALALRCAAPVECSSELFSLAHLLAAGQQHGTSRRYSGGKRNYTVPVWYSIP